MDEFVTVHEKPAGRGWLGVAFCVLAVALLLYAVVITVVAFGLRDDLVASNHRATCRSDLSAQVDVVLIDELSQFNTLLADLTVQPRDQATIAADVAAFQQTQAHVLDVRRQRANTAATCDRSA